MQRYGVFQYVVSFFSIFFKLFFIFFCNYLKIKVYCFLLFLGFLIIFAFSRFFIQSLMKGLGGAFGRYKVGINHFFPFFFLHLFLTLPYSEIIEFL
jgi:hypothetical protein